MSSSLPNLNQLPPAEFVKQVGPLFEHSPWIAERTATTRPFATVDQLYAALCATVDAASKPEKITLIRAHPDLAGKLAIAHELTEHSTSEQQSARLDQLSPAQFSRITVLNERYRATFGFPFVICVKDHTQESIFREFEQRVNHAPSVEISAALKEIKRIAWHRLQLLIGS